jgi:hypothetical protein
VLATAASPRGGAVSKPPGAAVCVPKTIRMEYFSSLGAKLGEYDARFQEIAKVYPNDPYSYKCLWYASAPKDEAFVVFIGITPPGIAGRITAGNCDGTRKDSYPFYNSRKRYLGVSGGNRKEFQNAVGGNEKILKGVLAAAEAAGVGVACPGTKPKPPPPAPKPKPPPPPSPPPLPPSTGDLGIEYTMPDRFGLPLTRRMIDYQDTIAEIRPDRLRVDFEIARKGKRGCVPGDVIAISVDGTPLTPSRLTRTAPCKASAFFPKEGVYRIGAGLRAKSGETLAGERTIVVQDWLIVGLGDSNGSGEGTPDVPAYTDPANKLPRWQNRQCHRSANSYQAKTALELERRDSRTSVTFVHLACSGATMLKGLLLPYEGIEEGLGPDQPAQVKELRRLVGSREVDAVMISIGVNDLRFGAMVGHCLSHDDCSNQDFPEEGSPRTLAQEIVRLLRLLPNRYAKVGAALEGAGVAKERVYLSEYFDSTRNSAGRFCNPLIRVPGVGTFDRDEAEWAHDRVLVKLNQAVGGATDANRWGGPIRGAYRSFREHGYCATDSWIVPLSGSFLRQLNKEGTLHANVRGNTEQAKDATLELRKAFYPGGRTRWPK